MADELVGTIAKQGAEYRQKMYDAMSGSSSETEETAAPAETEDTDTSTETEETAASAETDDTDTSTESEETDESPEDDSKQKRKTVPLAALHEERELHKATRQQVNDLAEKVNMLLQDNQRLMDKLDAPRVNLDDMDPTEREIYELRQEVKQLRMSSTKTQQTQVEDFQKSVDTTIAQVDKELIAEGYPGFAALRFAVAQKMREEAIPDNLMLQPETLKRVFKNHVYPQIAEQFDAVSRSKRIQDKNNRKKDANLLGNHGNQPKKKPSSDADVSFDAYIQRRKYVI